MLRKIKHHSKAGKISKLTVHSQFLQFELEPDMSELWTGCPNLGYTTSKKNMMIKVLLILVPSFILKNIAAAKGIVHGIFG